jgi:actin-like ATPase involved in cell morphogenesis
MGKTPQDFLSDFTQAIYEFLFKNNGASGSGRFDNFFKGTLAESKVEIVIATPPGWAQAEHLAIREAVTQMGLKSSQVFLASETEYLFRQWVDEYKRNGQDLPLKENETILVVDAGGGTAVITCSEFSHRY